MVKVFTPLEKIDKNNISDLSSSSYKKGDFHTLGRTFSGTVSSSPDTDTETATKYFICNQILVSFTSEASYLRIDVSIGGNFIQQFHVLGEKADNISIPLVDFVVRPGDVLSIKTTSSGVSSDKNLGRVTLSGNLILF